MKRSIALILAALISASLVACGNGTNDDGKDSTSGTESVSVSDTADTVDTADTADTEDTADTANTEADTADTDVVEGETDGSKLYGIFEDAITANPDATLEELANAVCSSGIPPFAVMPAPMEEGWLNGFDAESITGFSECVAIAPMMSTIPFLGYIFKLADDADVDAFIANLEATANLRWNICTEAEELTCKAVDNTVFFLMCNKDLNAEQ